MKLTGSQIFVEVLVEQGVDTLFGYPGGAVLNPVSYTHLINWLMVRLLQVSTLPRGRLAACSMVMSLFS